MKAGLAVGFIITAASFPVLAAQGSADTYPTRPVRILVPQGPSGSNDMMARYFGGALSERLGKQFVVDNRPGAEGSIATDIVAKAAPDGYTLLIASAAFTQNPAVMNNLPYDPVKNLDSFRIFCRAAVLIVVGP